MGKLVLTRKPGERVVIGKDVIVEVTEIGSGKVRLGFLAPPDVTIFREELLNRDDDKLAAPPGPTD